MFLLQKSNGLRRIGVAACAAIMALSFSARNADAVTTTFNFLEHGPDQSHTVLYEDNGIDLAVSAFKNFGTPNYKSRFVTRTIDGIGVAWNPSSSRIGDGEQLKFVFGTPLSSLASVAFVTASGVDEIFSIYDLNDVLLTTVTIAAGGGALQTIDLAGLGLKGLGFSIVGEDSGAGAQGVRIANVTISTPLPASLLLLAGGLFVLGAAGSVRRRRQQAA